jgi:DNA-directed RNA polymerase subunit RPC12/RpoP
MESFNDEVIEIVPEKIEFTYECGLCKSKVKINQQDPVRCKECGYRILYKLRSKRPSEYLAR